MTFRVLLLPFSWIFGSIAFLRNKCFDLGIFKSWKIPVKSICVGNLSTGGTGKTPHVAYLAENLSTNNKVAILSRGYGRKTSGFILVEEHHNTFEVGDEPLLYKKKFGKDIVVAVSENRKLGIQALLDQYPDITLILLDDAFQHRKVSAGLKILLTPYEKPFSSDLLLPAGNLREGQYGRHRADLIVVTKCPQASETDTKKWSQRLKFDEEKLHFSEISYGQPLPFGQVKSDFNQVLLITGIADPTPMVNYLETSYEVTLLSFSDHHQFTSKDIQKIHGKFDTFAPEKSIILTTEKDFMRLIEHSDDWKLNEYPWYYLPISVKVKNEEQFLKTVQTYVDSI
jgi:tetraacyldisaccharide 4'-kinase